jgi:S-adenosylmethionine:tRNA ribosyltransferase-isomerase
MDVSVFDFDLPEELIALRPASPRDSARLLVVRADGGLEHRHVRDLPELLHAGDALVVNDTKVIPARLYGRREARSGQDGEGPKIEILLHRRVGSHSFSAFAKPARKLAVGDFLALGDTLVAQVSARHERGELELVFGIEGTALDEAIAREGEMPLPPYIAGKRKTDARDRSDYQTYFADREGSVAAPTAGLHFTEDLLSQLESRGIAREHVTLHVGAGTFLPVTADDTAAHRMHAEWASLDGETAARLNKARANGGRIVAVGTMMKRAYAEAIAQRYRFYSYGDACLLFRGRA